MTLPKQALILLASAALLLAACGGSDNNKSTPNGKTTADTSSTASAPEKTDGSKNSDGSKSSKGKGTKTAGKTHHFARKLRQVPTTVQACASLAPVNHPLTRGRGQKAKTARK